MVLFRIYIKAEVEIPRINLDNSTTKNTVTVKNGFGWRKYAFRYIACRWLQAECFFNRIIKARQFEYFLIRESFSTKYISKCVIDFHLQHPRHLPIFEKAMRARVNDMLVVSNLANTMIIPSPNIPRSSTFSGCFSLACKNLSITSIFPYSKRCCFPPPLVFEFAFQSLNYRRMRLSIKISDLG